MGSEVLRDIYKALRKSGGVPIRVEVLPNGSNVVVRSNGLAELGLPEVEIAGCPLHLQDVAKNLVRQFALNGRDEPEAVTEGKTIGSRFARSDQVLLEAFRLERSDASSPTLRIVDLENNGRVFPRNLIATHLCATASASPRDQLRLLLVAIEVWPKQSVASNAPLGDFELNPNNFWSWIDLGTLLVQGGQISDALAHWKTAICMWPRGGKMYAARMSGREAANSPGSASPRAVADFWRSVTDGAIQAWACELAVELPELTLAD